MFIVEGNIGVGKSTFLEVMGKYNPEIEIVPEPKENWTKEDFGQSLLKNFYQDISRWAYTLETLTMIHRTKAHILEQSKTNPFRLVERSIYSGHFCFAKNDYETGHLSDVEWEIYNEWVNFLVKDKCKAPHGFIYLKASPETCLKRIKKRNRISEEDITLDYLKNIEERHDQFLLQKKDVFDSIKNVPVLEINCDEGYPTNNELIEKISTQLKDFFKKNTPLTY